MTNKVSGSIGKPCYPHSVDLLVDARHLRCPMPLLKAKQALNNVTNGQRVRVLATDAGSVRDFHAFADLSPHKLEYFNETAQGEFEYVLLKNGGNDA